MANKKIERLRIKNFKAFREEIDIEINGKSLLIYGNNGSGKSSIFWALYTMLQSTVKTPDEIKKYFKIYNSNDPTTYESLRNIFESDSEDSYIALKFSDDPDDYKISLNEINNLEKLNLKTLNATSDFITYKLLSNFYNSSHKNDLNLWPIFERDIFPFLTDSSTTQNYLEYIKLRTSDAPRYSRSQQYFREGLKKRNFNDQLSIVNTKISSLLLDIQRSANSFLQEHFYKNESKFRITLEFDKKFHFNILKSQLWKDENKHLRYEELRIKLNVEQKEDITGNWKKVERIQSFLNEAQLTRIAFSIRVGALRTRIQNLYPKILVLDDMLISLDMSNRLDVIKTVLNVENKQSLRFFDEFQKIILTHDKGFYNILKNYTNPLEWDYFNLNKIETSHNSPNLNIEKSHLDKAERFLQDLEFDACGNELRKELEVTLKKYLQKGQNILEEEYETLKSMLNKAYEKYMIDERRNYEKTFFNELLTLENSKKINEDFESDNELDAVTKGKLRSTRVKLGNYFIKMQEVRTQKDLIFTDLNVFLDRVMNPASHSSTEPLYGQELRKAIELITNFKNDIEAY